jgi:hypothetical protein
MLSFKVFIYRLERSIDHLNFFAVFRFAIAIVKTVILLWD